MEPWLAAELFGAEHRNILSAEEAHASSGKNHRRYLHSSSQEPKQLAASLDVVPDNALSPQKYLLSFKSNTEHQTDEITFRVQGYLVDFELPPILKREQVPRNVFWAKQRVRISGLGSPNFLHSVMGFKTIYEVMTRRLPADSCYNWNAVQFENCPALELRCPYFAKDSTDCTDGFPSNIDPHGILAHAGRTKGLRPSTPSLVEYYERCTESAGEGKLVIKHKNLDPATLRRGYLVEATAAFQLNRTKKGKWVFSTLLRSVEVLGQQMDEVYLRWKLREANKTTHTLMTSKLPLKRRREYEDDEEIETTRERFRKIALNMDIGSREAPGVGDITMEDESR